MVQPSSRNFNYSKNWVCQDLPVHLDGLKFVVSDGDVGKYRQWRHFPGIQYAYEYEYVYEYEYKYQALRRHRDLPGAVWEDRAGSLR